jgi:hypothetical protein
VQFQHQAPGGHVARLAIGSVASFWRQTAIIGFNHPAGCRRLGQFVEAAFQGWRPSGGCFVEFWRLFAEWPNVIACAPGDLCRPFPARRRVDPRVMLAAMRMTGATWPAVTLVSAISAMPVFGASPIAVDSSPLHDKAAYLQRDPGTADFLLACWLGRYYGFIKRKE